MPEIMKILGSTKTKITNQENRENVQNLEITEVVLVHVSIVNNGYQHDLKALHTFVPIKLFGQLLDILPFRYLPFILLKNFNSEFPYTEAFFTYENSKLLGIEDKIKTTLVW